MRSTPAPLRRRHSCLPRLHSCRRLCPFQYHSRDTDRIHPHRHMAPTVHSEPSRMRRKPLPPLGTLRHDVVPIAERHRHGNRDIRPRKRRAACLESIFECRRLRQVVQHANRISRRHAPAAHGDRHSKYRFPQCREPHKALRKSWKPGRQESRSSEHIPDMRRGSLFP